MNFIEALSDKFGEQQFSRSEAFALSYEKGFPKTDVRNFLANDAYKVERGVYSVAGAAPAKAVVEDTEPEKQETDAEILARITDRFDILEKLSESAAHGDTRALIVSGPPGLGKTHTVTETIIPNAVQSKILSGSASPIGLFRALWETRFKGSVLVIDDCDSVFYDLGALNLIKAACDSTKKRTIRWCTDYHMSAPDGDDKPEKEFEYEGTLIFITNIDFDKSIKQGSKIAPHIEALLSRAHYLSLGIRNRRDYLIRIVDVIQTMYKKGEFNKEEAQDAIKFIMANATSLRELSVRTAIKLTQLRHALPNDWERTARVTMCKGY